MPRGVYDRSKKASAKQSAKKESFHINIEGDVARRWIELERQLNEKYPFKLSRPQMISVLITKFEETEAE
ncbi:MAG: hypothetical protein L7S45_00850 [Luminiphilus sp.]|nr:hypothetical protein [Luminiphilus sp.]